MDSIGSLVVLLRAHESGEQIAKTIAVQFDVKIKSFAFKRTVRLTPDVQYDAGHFGRCFQMP